MKIGASLLLVLILSAGAAQAGDDPKPLRLTLEPADLTLKDPDQGIQILVTAQMSDGTSRDATLTSHYTFAGKSAEVAAVHKGRITPNLTGKTTLSIRYG